MLGVAKHLYKNILRINYKYLFYIFLSLWFLINIIQSLTTGIIYDEAYYHFYSENLAWGFFDHPPIVALMIKLSSFLFSNELSIRFITVVLQLFTLLIIWKTIDNKQNIGKDVLIFFGISSSVVMFVVYGFITTPDSSLLFFTALFLFSYKRFLKEESLLNCILLTLSMAGLIYSKYQGGLVIAFVILSNPKLLLNYKFWLSGIVALVLLSPHLIWQIQNDFVSFKYHLDERSRPFKLSYFLEYLPNQAVTFNPFILAIIGYILYKFKTKDLFFKSLKYIIVGMILFFWVATTRGHSEPQWTIAASIPMIIMLFYYSKQSCTVNKYLKKFVYPSILIIFLLRGIIANDSMPLNLEFYNQEKWALNIKEIAGDRAVIFQDGYQKPSEYRFYAKAEATTINSVYYRQNQYDLYNFNRNFYNRKIMIVSNKNDSLAKPFKILKNDSIYVRFSDRLVLPSDLKITFDIGNLGSGNNSYSNNTTVNLHTNVNDTLHGVIITNRGIGDIDFNDSEYPISLHLIIFTKKNRYSIPATIINPQETILNQSSATTNTLDTLPNTTIIHNGESISRDLHFIIQDTIPPGRYKIILSLKCGPFREGYNSKPQKVSISKFSRSIL